MLVSREVAIASRLGVEVSILLIVSSGVWYSTTLFSLAETSYYL